MLTAFDIYLVKGLVCNEEDNHWCASKQHRNYLYFVDNCFSMSLFMSIITTLRMANKKPNRGVL